MRLKFLIFSLGFVLLAFPSCKKPATSLLVSGTRKIDACSLITKEEVQAIQGSVIKDAKGSVHADGAFRVSQCFYLATDYAKSISLAVTQSDPDSPSKRSPKDFWEEIFGRYDGKEKERDEEEREKSENQMHPTQGRGEEEEEERTPPKKISGVGEEAYWTGSSMTGALYVLKKNVIIRIGVGGPDNEEFKIDKSKAVAKKTLERL